MSKVEEIFKRVKSAQPYPKVARRVMELLADPQTNASDLAEVIQYDQVIVANVLKICNAPYFGLSRKISSLKEALVVLGHESLKEIIIASSSSRFYQEKAGAGYVLLPGDLWKHSVTVAILAKLLVAKINSVDPAVAFTAGLLHDLGKCFLSDFVAADFSLIMNKVLSEKFSFVEAEQALLGITHAELGGFVLKRWEFPSNIQQAVLHHHDPGALEQEPLTALVALSNALAISMGIGVGADGLAIKMRGVGLERFGITESYLDLCMANLFMELEKAENLLRL